MTNFPSWADHILALLVGCIIPMMTTYRNSKSPMPTHMTSSQKKSMYVSGSLSLFFIALVVVLVWVLSRRPLEELGLKRPGEDSSYWWFLLVFVGLYIGDTVFSVVVKENREKTMEEWRKRTSFLPTRRNELPLYLLLCFNAGVFEEIIFRGFLVNYCYYLFPVTGQRELWAVTFPALVFSIAHYYQGTKAVIKIFVLSILFGFIFIRSNSLLVVMALHFLVDAGGGILTMKLMKEEEKVD